MIEALHTLNEMSHYWSWWSAREIKRRPKSTKPNIAEKPKWPESRSEAGFQQEEGDSENNGEVMKALECESKLQMVTGGQVKAEVGRRASG